MTTFPNPRQSSGGSGYPFGTDPSRTRKRLGKRISTLTHPDAWEAEARHYRQELKRKRTEQIPGYERFGDTRLTDLEVDAGLLAVAGHEGKHLDVFLEFTSADNLLYTTRPQGYTLGSVAVIGGIDPEIFQIAAEASAVPTRETPVAGTGSDQMQSRMIHWHGLGVHPDEARAKAAPIVKKSDEKIRMARNKVNVVAEHKFGISPLTGELLMILRARAEDEANNPEKYRSPHATKPDHEIAEADMKELEKLAEQEPVQPLEINEIPPELVQHLPPKGRVDVIIYMADGTYQGIKVENGLFAGKFKVPAPKDLHRAIAIKNDRINRAGIIAQAA